MWSPSIDDSVHVIAGDSAACSLRSVGGRDTIVLRDLLYPGPCDVNPSRHRQKREAFLRGFAQLFDGRDRRLYAAHLAKDVLNGCDLADRLATLPERPVLLWTSQAWHDRLHLWWVVDAVQRTRLRLGRFWVAEPTVEEGIKPEHVTAFSLGAFSPKCFRDAEATVRPLDREMAKTGSSLWRAFAGRIPTAFALACRQARQIFPDLPEVARPYCSLFPRLVRRRLMLSEIDQALLGGLRTSTWRTLVGMLHGDSRVFDFLGCFGDLYLVRRLREWAQTPAVVMRETGGGNAITAVSFRLTAEGERLLEQGMARAAEAPTMWIGGCRLYGRSPIWVKYEAWRFEQVDG
jgi:hypothetical protein